MTKPDVPVVRIVVDGCPTPRSRRTNVPQARGMLLRAFESNQWPGEAMFLPIPIESVFISAVKIEALGTCRCTTVAARRDDVDADTQPSPRPIRHHG